MIIFNTPILTKESRVARKGKEVTKFRSKLIVQLPVNVNTKGKSKGISFQHAAF